jgi:hypothetical protein
MDDAPRVRPRSRAAWRAWLARPHARRGGVWGVLDEKGARRPDLSAADVAEEALGRAPARTPSGRERLPPSARRGFLGWIDLARRPATRASRAQRIVWMAARGLRDPSAARGESP